MGFRILTVCTGNVCRSPVAERLLTQGLDAAPAVEVISRGTHAYPGEPISPIMAELLHQRTGLGSADMVAHRLMPDDVRDADLILGMTRAHRSYAVKLYPSAVQRAFTLSELARLVRDVDQPEVTRLASTGMVEDRLRALTLLARQARRPVPVEWDDIPDPIGQDRAVYEQVFDRISADTGTIVTAVTGRNG